MRWEIKDASLLGATLWKVCENHVKTMWIFLACETPCEISCEVKTAFGQEILPCEKLCEKFPLNVEFKKACETACETTFDCKRKYGMVWITLWKYMWITVLLLRSQKPVKYPVKHPVIYSAKYREVVMSTEACETPCENMCEKQMLLWEYK